MAIVKWSDGKFYVIYAVGGYMALVTNTGFETLAEAELFRITCDD